MTEQTLIDIVYILFTRSSFLSPYDKSYSYYSTSVVSERINWASRGLGTFVFVLVISNFCASTRGVFFYLSFDREPIPRKVLEWTCYTFLANMIYRTKCWKSVLLLRDEWRKFPDFRTWSVLSEVWNGIIVSCFLRGDWMSLRRTRRLATECWKIFAKETLCKHCVESCFNKSSVSEEIYFTRLRRKLRYTELREIFMKIFTGLNQFWTIIKPSERCLSILASIENCSV